VFGTAGGVYAIWAVDRDGSHERILTSDSVQTFCPSISPDGTRIAAAVWGPLNRFLTIFAPDGKIIGTPDGPIWDYYPGVWSPDGRTIAVNGRSITGGEDPRAFVDPMAIAPPRTFFIEGAFITDWQRLAP
jgi:Tol biopolymer transport system component